MPISVSVLALISLHYGTVSGCEMNYFWIEYSQRYATAAVGYSFHAAGLELVLGQDETQ